ncbi:acyl carrier protein [Goodfellowiella coeruleoviolacea]|uniref:Acyl carrier protein n=1 Tax=Goodfellowiella coeruleoviolacea TaxID=334858 RepID=A0AAE3G9E1_9PSEU|nr:acyl carrier protein [Goodfellowiella coeruleoviolacea]MCP2164087.1 acyl carrier protein [Goodfellowiella coeruleoviolacea]
MTQGVTGTPSALQDKIREIVAEELELDQDELSDTGHFVDDYDADSLSLITVIARIEKELGVAVPRDQLTEMATLEQVFAVVGQYATGESRGA